MYDLINDPNHKMLPVDELFERLEEFRRIDEIKQHRGRYAGDNTHAKVILAKARKSHPLLRR